MIHSPARIISELLVKKNLGTRFDAQRPWPVWYGVMPSEPDNSIAVYDTFPLKDGRLMKTGVPILHPGIQVRIRHNTYNDGWNKGDDIASLFDTIRNEVLTFGGRTYKIHNISRVAGVLPLGQETGKTRFIFTLNVTITLSDISP